jgi:phosphonoacetaldehyde hydrolase
MKLLNAKVPPAAIQATKLKAVVLDWAGTTVDFGSVAPARTLQKVFQEDGIELTDAEVRRDMGLPKRDHIRGLFSLRKVRDTWQTRQRRAPTDADVEATYQRFIPAQLACLSEYSALIPGVLDSVKRFRARGLKIGSTTGYTRAMLDLLVEMSAKAGYRPDCSLSPEDVGVGRPEPFMLYENAIRLQVYPLTAIAKIGDTPADIEEGLNAGAWCIGVAGTGNGIGLSREEFEALPAGEIQSRLAAARAELERAGAHYVVDTLAEVDAVLGDIDARLLSAASPRQATAK